MKIVVDSSVWVEIFLEHKLTSKCKYELFQSKPLLFTPSLGVYEVYKHLLKKVPDHQALEAVGFIKTHTILDLTEEVALLAADLAYEYKLGMADSIVLAHAQSINGVLLTLDNDFSDIPGTKIIR